MVNCKNYATEGGDTWVVGGTLKVEGGGKLKFGDTELKQGEAVADAAGSAPTAAEFKALLDSLRTAGVIKTAT